MPDVSEVLFRIADLSPADMKARLLEFAAQQQKLRHGVVSHMKGSANSEMEG